mmetsp:Transcript_8821/g.12593  ORF Transcript_8821/g.12593 Transcript_8821/m.12593 type:complete len:100 (+) Transcript_8821:166-465(+)
MIVSTYQPKSVYSLTVELCPLSRTILEFAFFNYLLSPCELITPISIFTAHAIAVPVNHNKLVTLCSGKAFLEGLNTVTFGNVLLPKVFEFATTFLLHPE